MDRSSPEIEVRNTTSGKGSETRPRPSVAGKRDKRKRRGKLEVRVRVEVRERVVRAEVSSVREGYGFIKVNSG